MDKFPVETAIYRVSLTVKMKNSTSLAGWSFWAWGTGHGEQGMGHGEEVTNALCPKRRGGCPSPRHSRDRVSRRFQ